MIPSAATDAEALAVEDPERGDGESDRTRVGAAHEEEDVPSRDPVRTVLTSLTEPEEDDPPVTLGNETTLRK